MAIKIRPGILRPVSTIWSVLSELLVFCGIGALIGIGTNLASDDGPEIKSLFLDSDGSVDWMFCGVVAIIVLHVAYRVLSVSTGSIAVDGDRLVVGRFRRREIPLEDIDAVCLRESDSGRDIGLVEIMSIFGLERLGYRLGLGHVLVILKDGSEVWLPGFSKDAVEAIKLAMTADSRA